MVLPVDPLTGAALLVMASSARDFCGVTKPAEINVIPRTSPVEYDYSQSLEQLQTRDVDTINPYGFDSISHTNGYMEGVIELEAKVELDQKIVGNRAHCLWYDKISVGISIDPKIVIAKEVAQNECMLKAVAEHELKHVVVDRKIVNKYARTIGRKVYDGLKQRGFVVAVTDPAQAQAAADRMQQTVNQIIEFEYKKLEIDRTESQQAVDSLEEYQSVSAKCPEFKDVHQHVNRSASKGRKRR